jgi:hypothetical protein
MVAFARSAINPCSAGRIALSSVPSRYQQGIPVFQAGGPDGPANAVSANGRCVAAVTAVVALSTSLAKASWNPSGSR